MLNALKKSSFRRTTVIIANVIRYSYTILVDCSIKSLYPDELDEDIITITEDLIEKRRTRKHTDLRGGII